MGVDEYDPSPAMRCSKLIAKLSEGLSMDKAQ